MTAESWDGNPRRQSDVELTDIKIALSGISQSLKIIGDTQSRHDSILYGKNGADGGLIIALDRLIQHKKRHDTNIVIVYAAIVGLFFKEIWKALFNR